MSGTPVGLDFAAVMAMGSSQGSNLELLAAALPEVEIVMMAGMSGEVDGEDD